MKNKKEFCSSILDRVKKESDKRSILYEYGVDLANYENEYISCLMESLVFIIGGENTKDYLEWWLYEDVDKIIYIDDAEINVESSRDLLNFLIDGEEK